MTTSGHGSVIEFDDAVGLGEVEADDGGRYGFHCTQIAGGSRTIAVGAEVTFAIAPARLGRWEAVAVTPLTPQPPAGDGDGD